MNSRELRSRIDRAIAEDERTGNLAKLLADHLKRSGVSMPPAQQAATVAFIRTYIKQTPDILDAVFAAATRAKVIDGMQSIFDAAFHYWAVRDDLIPDQNGLIGLADDAYLSLHLMEVASNQHQQQAGRPLLSIDLGAANQMMRGLIGEPIASQLDAIVGQTVAARSIQIGLRQLGGFGGAFPLMMPDFGGGSSYSDISREADIRLGAMGGPLPY